MSDAIIKLLNDTAVEGEIIARLSKLKVSEENVKLLPATLSKLKDYKFRATTPTESSITHDKSSKLDIWRQLLARLLFHIIRFQDIASHMTMTQEFFNDKTDRSTAQPLQFDGSVSEYLIQHVDHPEIYELVNSIYSYPSFKSHALYNLDARGQEVELMRMAREGQFRLIRHMFVERGGQRGYNREKNAFMWKVRLDADMLERLSRQVPKHVLGDIMEQQSKDPMLVNIEEMEDDAVKKQRKIDKKKHGKVSETRRDEQDHAKFIKMRKEYIAIYHAHNKKIADDVAAAAAATAATSSDSSTSSIVAEATTTERTSCTTQDDYDVWTKFSKVLKDSVGHLVSLSTQFLPNIMNKHTTSIFPSIFWVLVKTLDVNKMIIPKKELDGQQLWWCQGSTIGYSSILDIFLQKFYFINKPIVGTSMEE